MTVTVTGEVDAVTGDRLSAALADAIATSEKGVVVDMQEVTFFGSEGVRAIMGARQLATDSRRTLAVARPSPVVRRLLAILGLEELVTAEAAGA